MEFFAYNIVLMVCMTIILNSRVRGQTYDNMTNLHSDLLSTYSTSVRPVLNQSDILNINITLIVYKLTSVDVVRGTYELTLQVFASWKDERMVWIPSDYGGLNQTTFDITKVFYPCLIIGNSLDVQLFSNDFLKVKYSYDGSAFFDPGDITVLTCVFHMKYWPFDKQICYISLLVYGFQSDQVAPYANNPSVITSHFVQGGEWWVDINSFKTKVDTSTHITQLHYKFTMSRRPTYYILTMLLPICSLGYMSGLAFFLPSDADTRVNYIMTIMLSLAVFLSAISDDIPRGLDSVPIICVLITTGILICAPLTVILIFNARIFTQSTDIPVSKFYKRLVRLTKVCRNKVDSQELKEGRSDEVLSIHDIKDMEGCSNDEQPEQDQPSSDTNITWEDVSLAIDKIVVVLLIPLAYLPAAIIITCCVVLSDYNDRKSPY